MFEIDSGIFSKITFEVVSGIPSEIISGIQGPQLLQHFQDLYQVGAKIISGLTRFYLGKHGKLAFTADHMSFSRSPVPN
jgi:hypothetical protein